MIRIEHLLRRTAAMFPDAPALREADREITWSAMEAECLDLARRLAALGVGPGDRVSILARNRITYIELYFACAMLSAVLVPLNTRLKPRELLALVERSRSRVVIAEPRFAEGLAPLPPGCRGVALADGAAIAGARIDGWDPLDAIAPADAASIAPSEDLSAVAVQMYTSGTTGLPKGAMLTHANVTSISIAWLLDLSLRSPPDTFLQVTPLFHVGALLTVIMCVATGACIILQPEFSPAAIVRALSTEGVTHTLMVPAIIRVVLDGLRPTDTFPSLRAIAYGASPIPAAELARALDRFRCAMVQGYGLTETGGLLTSLRPQDHLVDGAIAPAARLASAGRAALCVETRVVLPDGSAAAPGEVGEIVARGPNVFVGYHEMPEATAEVLRDGWFHTGDLATVDAEGFLTIVDRSKDMIIVGGENVYPREVEDVIRELASVSDVAVVGVPHDTLGEAVLALVVPRAPVDDAKAAVREVIWHARERLARFKCPSRVEFVAEIPRNAGGKVSKATLRAPYWAGRERKV